jgi:hypothetical protein
MKAVPVSGYQVEATQISRRPGLPKGGASSFVPEIGRADPNAAVG